MQNLLFCFCSSGFPVSSSLCLFFFAMISSWKALVLEKAEISKNGFSFFFANDMFFFLCFFFVGS
jgi:hypothetical protein